MIDSAIDSARPQDDPGSFQNSVFELTTDWRQYVHRACAPEGIWTLFHYLLAERGTVEFDKLHLRIARAPQACSDH